MSSSKGGVPGPGGVPGQVLPPVDRGHVCRSGGCLLESGGCLLRGV